MAEKRYFWIKLMDDFLWGDKVKFLMRQKNGAEYVVMYEMLCSLAKNSNGRLVKQLGNILIELDIDAIYGELKSYFEYDTIVVAMGLFGKLDLVYQEDESGVFTIKDFENMIGSEGASAARVRRFRENVKNQALQPPLQSNDNTVTPMSQGNDNGVTNPLQPPLQSNCRDKSLELDILRTNGNKNMFLKQSHERPRMRESYQDIIDNLSVEDNVRPMLSEFIKHCHLNGHILTNQKLSDILITMDMMKLSAEEKIKKLRDAINGGYYDIKR